MAANGNGSATKWLMSIIATIFVAMLLGFGGMVMSQSKEISNLKACQAKAEATQTAVERRLERIEQKLDKLIEER